MGKLTSNEIKARLEAAFPFHQAVAETYDYDARIRLEVTDDNGRILCNMPELLVGEAADSAFLDDLLHQIRAHVAEKHESSTGLDDAIRVQGRKTTIRQEHKAGQAKAMRGNNGPVIGKNSFGHWALIEGKSLPISAVDHAFLRGEFAPGA